MSVVRPIDRWFIEEVLPFERDLLAAAARWSASPDEARDLVQDVLARMLVTEGWSAIASPKGYMLRVMRNMAIDRMRRAKVIDFRHIVDLDDVEIADEAPDQHRIVEDRQMLEEATRAIAALPERCRTVFERCRVQGESPKQIAQELGLSLSTLEKRLARAIYLLTQSLGQRRNGTVDAAPSEETRRHGGAPH